jgi:hypothetical protein
MSNGAVRATCSDEKVRIVFWAPSWFEDVAAGQFSSTKKMVLLR